MNSFVKARIKVKEKYKIFEALPLHLDVESETW
jgi:hypothetical protein